MVSVGEKIRQRRIYLGMTQEELAHKVGYKSRTSINSIELKRDLPMKKLKPIADALEISVYDLMGWEERKDQGKYSYINSAAVAEIMLDPDSQKLIVEINSLKPEEKKELLKYAMFLKSKREG